MNTLATLGYAVSIACILGCVVFAPLAAVGLAGIYLLLCYGLEPKD